MFQMHPVVAPHKALGNILLHVDVVLVSREQVSVVQCASENASRGS